MRIAPVLLLLHAGKEFYPDRYADDADYTDLHGYIFSKKMTSDHPPDPRHPRIYSTALSHIFICISQWCPNGSLISP